MSQFTRLGCLVWEWDPWTSLDPTSRVLWLALYTSSSAKRLVPGLWHGGINVMADASRLQSDDVLVSLDKMIEYEMAEYDPIARVLRLTKLPDAGEWPSNPNILFGWWGRFLTVPECAVRDAHVTTIRWILEQGSRIAAKNRTNKPTARHEEVWGETFGSVNIPSPRHRGARRLTNSDTSTDVQAGLFSKPYLPHETLPNPSSEASSLPLPSGSADPMISMSDKPFPKGFKKEKEKEKEFSSLDSGAGSGVQGPADLEPPRPRLALVPMPEPGPIPITEVTTPAQLCAVLSAASGRYRGDVRQDVQAALQLRVRELLAAGAGPPELAVVGRWIAMDAGPVAQIPGDPSSKLSVWASQPGAILAALAAAREHERHEAERHDALQDSLRALGMLPGDR
jgi:hypothetical protein